MIRNSTPLVLMGEKIVELFEQFCFAIEAHVLYTLPKQFLLSRSNPLGEQKCAARHGLEHAEVELGADRQIHNHLRARVQPWNLILRVRTKFVHSVVSRQTAEDPVPFAP